MSGYSSGPGADKGSDKDGGAECADQQLAANMSAPRLASLGYGGMNGLVTG
ncbi:MAG: hypothetical protein OXH61_04515 [Acidimicrobiaceae bacterium]|nr:hypothetical protein [Acidimicrobiaceae bacterium]